MTMPATASRATAPRPNALTLVEIGERLKRAARARPGVPCEPPQPLSNRALLTMIYFADANQFFLRIARKGLSPCNDFSQGADTRYKRWRNEIKTFCRDIKIAETAEMYDGAEGLFYWVDIYWTEAIT